MIDVKCRIPKMSKKEVKQLKEELHEDFKARCRGYIRDMEQQAGCRAQWMLMMALVRTKGYAGKRLYGLWNEIGIMLEDLSDYADLGVMDEMLIRGLEQAGFDVHSCYKEYFEIADRLNKSRSDVEIYEELRAEQKSIGDRQD